MPDKPKSNDKVEDKDLFRTPKYATRLLLPFLTPYTMVWECAAGEGHMAQVLETQHAVWCTDIDVAPKGVVISNEQWNFLEQTKDEEWIKSIDYIVTNTPFTKKKAFYDKCMFYWRTYQIPFCLLVPADYSGWIINAVHQDMCQKIIPTRRIDYITPDQLNRINAKMGTNYLSLKEVPQTTLARFSSSKFHSMWLTQGLHIEIPKPVLPSEIYVPLSLKAKKEDIL